MSAAEILSPSEAQLLDEVTSALETAPPDDARALYTPVLESVSRFALNGTARCV